MAIFHSHFATAGRLRRAGALTLAALFAIGVQAGGAAAQQPKKAPEKAPAKKDTKAPAANAAAPQSAWVKLCETASHTTKNKEGKDEKKDLNICLTHHERLDGNTGMVLVSAAIRQVEGVDKQHFMVMVPLGMMLQPGMRATIYPKDLWEKVQKNEKPDESKLKAVKLSYTLCHPAGCTAEMEATPEFLGDIKGGGGIMVFAINANGAPVAFPVPLAGFDTAFAAGPVDSKKYGEARKNLMQQIAQRQQQIAAEYKKQNEELQKMQGAEAHKGAAAAPPPAAPAAKAPPAQKK
jgi:invasion protein IalB